MIVSEYAENGFDKIQHLIRVKNKNNITAYRNRTFQNWKSIPVKSLHLISYLLRY